MSSFVEATTIGKDDSIAGNIDGRLRSSLALDKDSSKPSSEPSNEPSSEALAMFPAVAHLYSDVPGNRRCISDSNSDIPNRCPQPMSATNPSTTQAPGNFQTNVHSSVPSTLPVTCPSIESMVIPAIRHCWSILFRFQNNDYNSTKMHVNFVVIIRD